MTDKRQPAAVDERDFDAIEAAVMETERGRWFLGEFARRNRMGETRLLLEAVTRLEQNVAGPRPPEEAEAVRAALAQLAGTLARAIAELGGGSDSAAALGSFVHSVATMEGATTDIHDAAERVSEIAWQLREAGASGRLCGELEKAAADISTACAFGGLTARRAKILADAVGAVVQGLDALPPAWRPVAGAAPARPHSAETVTVIAASAVPPAEEPSPEPPVRDRAPPAPVPPPRAQPEAEAARPEPRRPARSATHTTVPSVPSLAAIDRLDFRERLKLFT
jgi:hypothetical protein